MWFGFTAAYFVQQELQELASSVILTFAAPPISGEEILASARQPPPIATLCTSLNRILSGGLHLGEWLELVGEPSAGKTQVRAQAVDSFVAFFPSYT